MASDSSGSSMPSWQLLVLLAAAMGAFLTNGKIATPSPSAEEPANDKGILVDSHLSDDPFGAWVRAAKKSDSGGNVPPPGVPGGNLAAPIGAPEGFKSMIGGQRVCLLPVIVRGDFHSTEAREMRIRFRAATVSGLGAQGLVADDAEHLMLILPPQAWLGEAGRRPPSINQPLPAEWFLASGLPRQQPSPYGAVLVVWVQDETLFVNPLRALDALKADLTAQVVGLHGIDAGAIDFKVIGPYWSGTLTDIIAERKAALNAGVSNLAAGTIFYSATATMADGVLDLISDGGSVGPEAKTGPEKPGAEVEPTGRKRLAHQKNGPVLVNLTCTDEDLAEALINELMLRGVDIADRDTRIAIVSDWDTEYGRFLPLTYAAKLRQVKKLGHGYNPSVATRLPHLTAENFAELKFDEDRLWPRQVLRAFFIAGVGGTATSEAAASGADDPGKSSGDSPDARPLERAEGEHQVDYIARLGLVFANRLTERDHPESAAEKASSKPSSPKLLAVGLLGSNVNDDLLLLQVLRPRFPDAVFFTDKLDARFLDSGSAKYTRNLVVASTYGFELFQKLQVGVTPFRSSEQTGAFLAVQAAIASRAPDLKALRDQLLPPLRFEIGRTYPVPLFVPGRSQIPANTEDRFHDSLHPKFDMPLLPEASFWSDHGVDILSMLFGAAFFGAMTLFIFLGRFRLEASERPDVLAVALLAAAAVAVVLVFQRIYDGFEPITWIEGVSIWPTEFFRLLALITAAGGIYYCGSRARQSRILLCEEFGLVRPPQSLSERTGIFASMGEVVRRMPLSKDDYLVTELEDDAAVRYLEEPSSDYRGGVAAAVAARQKATREEPLRYISSQLLWRYLCERSTPGRRCARAGLMTLCYFGGWICLFYVIGIPLSPTRGNLSVACDRAMLFAASLLMVYLIFWVVDETQSCYRFVSRLGDDNHSLWPGKAFEKIPSVVKTAGLQANAEWKAASAYVDVLFIGRLTSETVPLIILPFAVLTLLIFARWTFFANWHMSASVLAFYGEDAAICVLCALLLKLAATRAKVRALRNIGLNAADARAAGADGFANALQALQADMEANQEGAFLPWHQQPVVRAVLLPFGGSGMMQAVEFMMSK